MGDFSAHFQRPDSGIHTVEGNVAGSRAAALTKQRNSANAAFESRKSSIQAEAQKGRQGIHDKFSGGSGGGSAEEVFRAKTVGLVSREEFVKATKERAEGKKRRREEDGVIVKEEITQEQKSKMEKRQRKERKKANRKRKKLLSTLSFADDADGILQDQDDQEETSPTHTKMKKNPNVDTSFLPDKEREHQIANERQRLKAEWTQRQSQIRQEALEIVYSYWDGSGHRRTVQVRKGDTIAQFLELVRKDLAADFREMVNVSSDALLYVKEDLIIPQDISFYDLIVTKARGKSGPLFQFDVHDDIRVGAIDSRVEKDESHPGKVVERRWYERNKHIFPASRWEIFDPAKDYGRYTIGGGEVNKGKKKK